MGLPHRYGYEAFSPITLTKFPGANNEHASEQATAAQNFDGSQHVSQPPLNSQDILLTYCFYLEFAPIRGPQNVQGQLYFGHRWQQNLRFDLPDCSWLQP